MLSPLLSRFCSRRRAKCASPSCRCVLSRLVALVWALSVLHFGRKLLADASRQLSPVASREFLRGARSAGYASRVVGVRSFRLHPVHCSDLSAGGVIAGDVRLQSDCFHMGGAGLPSYSSKRLVLANPAQRSSERPSAWPGKFSGDAQFSSQSQRPLGPPELCICRSRSCKRCLRAAERRGFCWGRLLGTSDSDCTQPYSHPEWSWASTWRRLNPQQKVDLFLFFSVLNFSIIFLRAQSAMLCTAPCALQLATYRELWETQIEASSANRALQTSAGMTSLSGAMKNSNSRGQQGALRHSLADFYVVAGRARVVLSFLSVS